ncbi:MAG: DUF4054 domain-containing protein [Methanobrevibacter sp.]|nr:DUF4054 domain-containing protein [Methanobrevibacter sp.]
MIITTEEFKEHFSRDFPYLTIWDDSKTYFKGDEVYFSPNFYESLVDDNTSELSDTTKWKVIKDSEDSYIRDADIGKAIEEAKLAFNADLFSGCECEAKLAMLYLTAFYLVLDIKNSSAGLASGYAGFTASKSVGNVSESYGIPTWVQTNPMLSLYLDNGYGKKYLTFLLPRVSGFIYVSPGAITED